MRKKIINMEEKYVLLKNCQIDGGVLSQGTEIMTFRGGYYVNGCIVAPIYYPSIRKVLEDPSNYKKYRIEKNTF